MSKENFFMLAKRVSYTSERKPLLALAMSLVMPGLGHIYNGEITKGLSLFIISAFCVPVFAWLAVSGPQAAISPVMLLGIVLYLACYFYSAKAAYSSAKKIGANFELLPINAPHAYLALVFFSYFFVIMQLFDHTRSHLIASYMSPTTSMVPTLLPGDRYFVDKQVNEPGAKSKLVRGDVVIFVNPNDRTQVFVKRIIGLPGDSIRIEGTRVFVNEKLIPQRSISDLADSELNQYLVDHIAMEEEIDGSTYRVLWAKNAEHPTNTVVVPNGHAFLLGDNRDQTMDSRAFGFVPLSDISAKPRQIYFSTSLDAGVRWERLGKLLGAK